MVNETKADIEDYLPANKGINADTLNPREVRNIYAWVDHPLDGGYVLYGTQQLFFETFPNYRNCLGDFISAQWRRWQRAAWLCLQRRRAANRHNHLNMEKRQRAGRAGIFADTPAI